MEIFFKNMHILGNNNFSDEVALQFEKEIHIATIHCQDFLTGLKSSFTCCGGNK